MYSTEIDKILDKMLENRITDKQEFKRRFFKRYKKNFAMWHQVGGCERQSFSFFCVCVGGKKVKFFSPF